MYGMIRTMIEKGGYDLSRMVETITQAWWPLERISSEERDALIGMAKAGADPASNTPGLAAVVAALTMKLEALEARVNALDGGTQEEETGYPVWKPWDGVSRDYAQGAIVIHNGRLWQSVYAGQNTWEPGAAGTGELWTAYNA